jgi:O-methyltransferase involved in polyketide biosynthesis
MKRIFGLILLLAVVLPACDRQTTPPDAGGLSREQFVELFVSLRNAKKSATTPADFEEKKRQLLAKANVTEEQFKRFADAHAEDLVFMAAVWDSIQSRLDRGDTVQQER